MRQTGPQSLLAPILVPIAVLFTICGAALACSEYWPIYWVRRHRISGAKIGHKGSRTDSPGKPTPSRNPESSGGDPDA